jgi:myo-inositol-1(or 4)-monophosphatase
MTEGGAGINGRGDGQGVGHGDGHCEDGGGHGRAEELLAFALVLAREAGELLAEGFERVERGEVDYKGWRNLVTKYDLASERLVIDRIRAAWPGHAILAEEGGGHPGTAPYRWIIDPLDGTTNFVHRHPFFCVSIGLEDTEGVLVGVVHAPQLRETFTAVRGGGAFRSARPFDGPGGFRQGGASGRGGAVCDDGESGDARVSLDQVHRLGVSSETNLGHALLASGFAYRQGEVGNTNLDNWSRLSLETRGLRRCGSAALDLAYVADGRYDGYWELALSPWDVAAGALLVSEAGGRITDARGGDDWLHGGSIVATNGPLHDLILSRLTVD